MRSFFRLHLVFLAANLLVGPTLGVVDDIKDLEPLKDDELWEIFQNPYGDPGKIPGADRPGEYIQCVGHPLINAMSNYSDSVPSVMPYGEINPFARFYGGWWMGKVLQTDRRGRTRGWNMVYTNNSVALTTDVDRRNVSITGDPRPVVFLNYSNSEEIWARPYIDEMRQVGENRYLGRTYFANLIKGFGRRDLDPVQDAAQTLAQQQLTEIMHAVLRARGVTGSGTRFSDQTKPFPVIFFALDCNYNATRMVRTSYSTAMRLQNGPLQFSVPAEILEQQPLNNGEPQWIP